MIQCACSIPSSRQSGCVHSSSRVNVSRIRMWLNRRVQTPKTSPLDDDLPASQEELPRSPRLSLCLRLNGADGPVYCYDHEILSRKVIRSLLARSGAGGANVRVNEPANPAINLGNWALEQSPDSMLQPHSPTVTSTYCTTSYQHHNGTTSITMALSPSQRQ